MALHRPSVLLSESPSTVMTVAPGLATWSCSSTGSLTQHRCCWPCSIWRMPCHISSRPRGGARAQQSSRGKSASRAPGRRGQSGPCHQKACSTTSDAYGLRAYGARSQDASTNMEAHSSLDGAALPAAAATEKSRPAAASEASASTSASATAPRPESPAHASSLIAVRMAVKPGPGSVSPRDSVAPRCRDQARIGTPAGAAQTAGWPRLAGARGQPEARQLWR